MYDELIARLRETPSIPVDAKLHNEAADAIEELQSVVDGLTTQTNMVFEKTEGRTVIKFEPKWIPVTEHLPKKDQQVFVYLFGDDPYIAWHDGEYWCTDEFCLDEPDDYQPTEWMPLPQPPKDGET